MESTIISIALQKGGSGKTTTAINLAAYLRTQGRKVLLVDLDPKANLTQFSGIREIPNPNIYHVLQRLASGQETPIDFSISRRRDLDIIPSSLDLERSEVEMIKLKGREKLLSQYLKKAKSEYDFIIIDCPPAMGLLTINALAASDFVIIPLQAEFLLPLQAEFLLPLQAEFLPLKGLQNFIKSIETIQKKLKPKLKVLGFLLTKYDHRKIKHQKAASQFRRHFGSKVFDTPIRANITLTKAQEKGNDIFSYARSSIGAADYAAFGKEVLDRINKVN